VHLGYGEYVDSGTETLHSLRRDERRANFAIAICFAAFFLVATYVTQRRIANSNTATYIVSPVLRTVLFPARVLRSLISAAFSRTSHPANSSARLGTPSPTSASTGPTEGRRRHPPREGKDASSASAAAVSAVNAQEMGILGASKATVDGVAAAAEEVIIAESSRSKELAAADEESSTAKGGKFDEIVQESEDALDVGTTGNIDVVLSNAVDDANGLASDGVDSETSSDSTASGEVNVGAGNGIESSKDEI
jgi:hypothetical protein